ncbi:MAG: glycosyltransferase involved in cell wall biosynthesis [Pseudohongiellaceae bacterium]
MKILLLTHRLPWPLHDGYNLHNDNYVRQLADRHEFHLVSMGAPPGGASEAVDVLPPEVRALYASVTVVPQRLPPQNPSRLLRLATAFSVRHVFDDDPAVAAAIADVLARESIDLVWASGAKMLVHSRRLHSLPVLGDIADEALKEAREDVKRARGLVGHIRALKNYLNTWRFQRQYLAHVNVCTVVSEVDKETLGRNCPQLDVRVIPNGVDAEMYQPQGAAPNHPSLVFEGSMGFRPNVEGIVAFCDDTLPLIRESVPEVRLTIVGRDPAPEVAALAGPGVEVTGFVDDVRPYVDRSSVFVCPLRRGAGIKNKILQAWAMEKAVVATSVSCGGLALSQGENIVVADGPENFAAAVVELLNDPEQRAILGRGGRKTVIERSSWEATSRQLQLVFEEVLAAGPRR